MMALGDSLLAALYYYTLDYIAVKVQEHISHAERQNKTLSQIERTLQDFLRMESSPGLIYNEPETAQPMACNLL